MAKVKINFEEDFRQAEQNHRSRKPESVKSLIDRYRRITGQTKQEAAQELAAELIKRTPEKKK